MKILKNLIFLSFLAMVMSSCSKDNGIPAANSVTLHFNNTFKGTTIVLGGADATAATVNTSAAGQVHHFSELKYVISDIRLTKTDGTEIPYNINNLDKGATVVNQSDVSTLNYVLNNIPSGEYKQLSFGLGVKEDLNTLDQERFPEFYAAAGKNSTEMMWEWGTGYRFTKIEGFYDSDNKELSIHSGSTVSGINGDENSYTQGVDGYRDITLSLPATAIVGSNSPVINIQADLDKLLSGKSNTITLSTGTGMDDNATPNIHTADQMIKFVDNLGGNGKSDLTGMFSIESVQ